MKKEEELISNGKPIGTDIDDNCLFILGPPLTTPREIVDNIESKKSTPKFLSLLREPVIEEIEKRLHQRIHPKLKKEETKKLAHLYVFKTTISKKNSNKKSSILQNTIDNPSAGDILILKYYLQKNKHKISIQEIVVICSILKYTVLLKERVVCGWIDTQESIFFFNHLKFKVTQEWVVQAARSPYFFAFQPCDGCLRKSSYHTNCSPICSLMEVSKPVQPHDWQFCFTPNKTKIFNSKLFFSTATDCEGTRFPVHMNPKEWGGCAQRISC